MQDTISSFFHCPFGYTVVLGTAISVIKTLSLTQRYCNRKVVAESGFPGLKARLRKRKHTFTN